MQLTHYPVLEDTVQASEIVTFEGSELLIYDTVSGAKKYANRATFDFLKLATGTRTCEEIVTILSRESGEAFGDIWPPLSELISNMRKEALLKVLTSPAKNPRNLHPPVNLVHRLQNVALEITEKCNLKCKHCYSDAGTPLENELTMEEMKELLDQMAKMGVLSVTFTGGEPFLHPHFYELIEYARKKPLTVIIFTNGTLITPQVAETLKNLQVSRVNVSIDGPNARIHNAFRKGEDAFQKTVKGVNFLTQKGIVVDASISIHRHNYQKMKLMLQLINQLKITEFKMWPITFSGRKEEKDIFITSEQFGEVVKATREFEIEEMGKKREEFAYDPNLKNCGIGRAQIAVKSNGIVTPCLSFGNEVSVGNIREQGLIDIWNNSDLLNELRSMSVFKTKSCRECEHAVVCKGGCIADVYGRTGEFSCYDSYSCVAFKMTKDDFIFVEDTSPSTSLSVEVV